MRLLFDTHAFLWLATDDPRLSADARARFLDPEAACFLSAASVWEMAIKASLGKLVLETTLRRLVQGGIDRGLQLLDVSPEHAYTVETLPYHHRDPFDRLLVAQAMHEGMALVSRDPRLDPYAVRRLW